MRVNTGYDNSAKGASCGKRVAVFRRSQAETIAKRNPRVRDQCHRTCSLLRFSNLKDPFLSSLWIITTSVVYAGEICAATVNMHVLIKQRVKSCSNTVADKVSAEGAAVLYSSAQRSVLALTVMSTNKSLTGELWYSLMLCTLHR